MRRKKAQKKWSFFESFESFEVMATQQSLVELRQKPLRLQPSGVSAPRCVMFEVGS